MSQVPEARRARARRSPMGEVMDSKRTLSAATSPTRERRTAEACIVMCVGVEEERTEYGRRGVSSRAPFVRLQEQMRKKERRMSVQVPGRARRAAMAFPSILLYHRDIAVVGTSTGTRREPHAKSGRTRILGWPTTFASCILSGSSGHGPRQCCNQQERVQVSGARLFSAQST
jgi:hypothetical protein